MNGTFGHTYEAASLKNRNRDFERARIGKTYILACKPRYAPCHIQWIFKQSSLFHLKPLTAIISFFGGKEKSCAVFFKEKTEQLYAVRFLWNGKK